MSSKNTAKTLARAVQDEVVHRRGGEPPSYHACLNAVRLEMATFGSGATSAAEWKAGVVERVAARMR